MTDPTRGLVTRHGGDAAGHRARMHAEADRVLALTRARRAAVITLHPARCGAVDLHPP